ncbi:hypothetical protein D3C76_449890 [compost metagenome]|uniref:DUF6285 domain-containing protein n=1 Tax=unclassified Pseudomonas TaxID=196821 RepID=UPI000BA415F5|nr:MULTISPECIES: DUF6285 domain-containing protein [unclassified Pseudomonas]MDD2130577.1 DUF6285 domain-containing protein [Pseudomonas sp. 17391]
MNQPDAHDLLVTAHEALLTHLLPALPKGLHYEGRMVASAMLIASRELAQAADCTEVERQALEALLAQGGQAVTELEQAREWLARNIRQGAYDQHATRLLEALRAINRAQLSISNPKVLAHD